jgi:hypothetical protein
MKKKNGKWLPCGMSAVIENCNSNSVKVKPCFSLFVFSFYFFNLFLGQYSLLSLNILVWTVWAIWTESWWQYRVTISTHPFFNTSYDTTSLLLFRFPPLKIPFVWFQHSLTYSTPFNSYFKLIELSELLKIMSHCILWKFASFFFW